MEAVVTHMAVYIPAMKIEHDAYIGQNAEIVNMIKRDNLTTADELAALKNGAARTRNNHCSIEFSHARH